MFAGAETATPCLAVLMINKLLNGTFANHQLSSKSSTLYKLGLMFFIDLPLTFYKIKLANLAVVYASICTNVFITRINACNYLLAVNGQETRRAFTRSHCVTPSDIY